MGLEHTFYDYVDDAGVNVIYAWLNSVPIEVKVRINNRLLHLEGTQQGNWTRPLVDTLTHGSCDGLFEVRSKFKRRQYRILGYHGPDRGNPTLLWAFIKTGAQVPETECASAQTIRTIIESGPLNYREEHNYG